jgi:hypothetical protein
MADPSTPVEPPGPADVTGLHPVVEAGADTGAASGTPDGADREAVA